MPRRGIQFHVDDPWRESVRERLAELGKKAAWLAAEAGCRPSLISELLSGKRDSTTYLPEIHRALGFPAPQGPLLSQDDEELLEMKARLTPEQRSMLWAWFRSLEDVKKPKR